MEPNGDVRISPKLIIGVLTVTFIMIVALIVRLWADEAFHKNPYDSEIKISNFDEYFRDVPKNDEDTVFYNLYLIVERNLSGSDIDKIVGMVRGDSIERDFNVETNVHHDSFLVDLENVKQTYRIQFEWSTTKDNQYIVGASVVATCPKNDELIFGDFNCTDIFIEQEELSNGLVKDFPIMEKMPIDIAYYDRKTGRYISYRIAGELSEDSKKYKILITDRSGDNYELALNRIREQWCGSTKCNPDDYEIEYRDVSLEGDADVTF